MFVWNAAGALLFISGITACALGVLVYTGGPRRAQNRWVAVLLVLEGIDVVSSGLRNAALAPSDVHALAFLNIAVWIPASAIYLGVLSTFPTPLVKPLRHPRALMIVLVLVASHILLLFTRTDLFVAGVQRAPFAAWGAFVPGPWLLGASAAFSLLLVFSLVAAVSAWSRAARGTADRTRAGAFALAFAARDTFLLSTYVLIFLSDAWYTSTAGAWINMVLRSASVLAFAALASYGILKHQLFDIDLRIKWTINRSTLVALFVAFFFVVSELATVVFAERVGTVLGILGAGLLLFAIAPLQRLADRLADTAMPKVRDDEEYLVVRKREVYRATLEEMLVDGVLTAKDRRALLRLQEGLGLDPTMAQRLEIDVLDGRRSS